MEALPDQLLSALEVGSDCIVTPLPGNENENYLVKATREKFVVKLLRAHSPSNTELEGEYRNYLADSGMPVARFKPLDNTLCVLKIGSDSYVATEYLDGHTAKTITKELIVETATVLAKTHSLDSSTLPKRESWFRKSYIPDSGAMLDDRFSSVKNDLITRSSHLTDFWTSDVPRGIIHGDLHKENIIINDEGNIVCIVDWEETAVEPLILDVAYTVRAMTFSEGMCNQVLFEAFFDAYQRVRPLSALEKSLFGTALDYSILVLSTWAHLKLSQHQMNNELFKRLGNMYKTKFVVPVVV